MTIRIRIGATVQATSIIVLCEVREATGLAFSELKRIIT